MYLIAKYLKEEPCILYITWVFFLLVAKFCVSVVGVSFPQNTETSVYLPFCLSLAALLWESRIVQLFFLCFFYNIWQVKFCSDL